ncbi:MAG: 4Fe-4S dicluster domain-containing protein [Nitrospinota bacterium]|nr:MAG: 4Fe-4S dicluster domain-containing protein [Nitrospinota bacterium]
MLQQEIPLRGFDTYEAPEYEKLQECIHCGLCLPYCPTYRILGMENDSPRGRLYLMRAVADGKIPMTKNFVRHMYLCLDCRACETACPSGVKFGELMETTRGQIERVLPRPWYVRLFRRLAFGTILSNPKWLALVADFTLLYQKSGLQKFIRRLGILDYLPDSLNVMEQMLPESLPPKALRYELKEVTPARGETQRRVGFLSGCVMQLWFTPTNLATVNVLARNGCEVVTPAAQRCCGALHAHSGEREMAKALARHNIDVFTAADVEAIIVNAAGCGAFLKEYAHLLKHDREYRDKAEAFSQKVKDISEFLTAIPLQKPQGEIRARVAYDDPCHLLHGQKIGQQPRDLLRMIPGIELVNVKEADWCCGSAGIYNIIQPAVSLELLERKIKHLQAVNPDIIASGNPGCLLQIGRGVKQSGMSAEVVHPIDLLERSYRLAE